MLVTVTLREGHTARVTPRRAQRLRETGRLAPEPEPKPAKAKKKPAPKAEPEEPEGSEPEGSTD